ncbi:MAG: LacI family transcriptional regulator [bacterium]|nr:LacI family transcriptional regulator [bacterium]
MKITTKQIASVCGVSIGTVNRAFYDKPGIKPTTKEKILKVAKELGYRPHRLARSLQQGKTMTIGIVVFDLDNQFFSQIVSAMERRADELDYSVYLALSGGDSHEEKKHLDRLAGLHVDGIVLLPVGMGMEFIRYLRSLNTPLVTIGNIVSKGFPFIGIPDRQAIKDAVAHIAAKDYQRIIYVSPPLSYKGERNITSVENRLAGYREGMKEFASLHKPVVIRDKKYLEALEKIPLLEGGKTAILCSSDIYALEILQFLRSKDLNVPKDVGLMGFDNIDLLHHVMPPLTTIAYPMKELGTKAVECLVAKIKGDPFSDTELLHHEIIERASL